MIVLLLQDNTTLVHLESLKDFFFTIWLMFWNISKINFFFLACKTLRAIVRLLFSNFSSHYFLMTNLFLPVYLSLKGLIFVILSVSFFVSSWFNATVTAYSMYLLSFLLIWIIIFSFLPNQENLYNLYTIHHDSDLYFDIYNTINEHNWRQNH